MTCNKKVLSPLFKPKNDLRERKNNLVRNVSHAR